MLKQVSIYAENKKGCLQNITGILRENNVNILGSVTNDSAEYGIISQRDYFDKAIANSENINGYYVVEPENFVYNHQY